MDRSKLKAGLIRVGLDVLALAVLLCVVWVVVVVWTRSRNGQMAYECLANPKGCSALQAPQNVK